MSATKNNLPDYTAIAARDAEAAKHLAVRAVHARRHLANLLRAAPLDEATLCQAAEQLVPHETTREILAGLEREGLVRRRRDRRYFWV